jgi:hypothetical protein
MRWFDPAVSHAWRGSTPESSITMSHAGSRPTVTSRRTPPGL